VFLVYARIQNGSLCDFIALLQSYFSRLEYKSYFSRLEYKHNDVMTFLPDLEPKNSFCLALICSGNG
jgi:hypothetical protein